MNGTAVGLDFVPGDSQNQQQSTPTTEEPLRRATSASRAKAFFALITDYRTW
jgi:hypothetical protein